MGGAQLLAFTLDIIVTLLISPPLFFGRQPTQVVPRPDPRGYHQGLGEGLGFGWWSWAVDGGRGGKNRLICLSFFIT